MRQIIIVIALLICYLTGAAQAAASDPVSPACVKGVSGLDTMLTGVKLKYKASMNYNREALNTYGYMQEDIPTYSDSVISYRMKLIESPIPLEYNSYVKAYIDMYSQRKRESVCKMLGASDYYFPLFEQILDKYNLPHEFKYLSVIESALNPNAQSWCGATGLWQFMYNTGLNYGLTINAKVDQRKDPVRATEAMCQYITNSYNQFGDWLLAIASYNCGPGWVSYAMRKGGSNNFWEIQQYLPSETRGYVPAFIAACYVFKYAPEHNLFPAEPEINYPVERVEIDHTVSFYQLSQVLGVSIVELEKLNPSYKKGVIPISYNTDFIVLPQDAAILYANNKQKIFNIPDVDETQYASIDGIKEEPSPREETYSDWAVSNISSGNEAKEAKTESGNAAASSSYVADDKTKATESTAQASTDANETSKKVVAESNASSENSAIASKANKESDVAIVENPEAQTQKKDEPQTTKATAVNTPAVQPQANNSNNPETKSTETVASDVVAKNETVATETVAKTTNSPVVQKHRAGVPKNSITKNVEVTDATNSEQKQTVSNATKTSVAKNSSTNVNQTATAKNTEVVVTPVIDEKIATSEKHEIANNALVKNKASKNSKAIVEPTPEPEPVAAPAVAKNSEVKSASMVEAKSKAIASAKKIDKKATPASASPKTTSETKTDATPSANVTQNNATTSVPVAEEKPIANNATKKGKAKSVTAKNATSIVEEKPKVETPSVDVVAKNSTVTTAPMTDEKSSTTAAAKKSVAKSVKPVIAEKNPRVDTAALVAKKTVVNVPVITEEKTKPAITSIDAVAKNAKSSTSKNPKGAVVASSETASNTIPSKVEEKKKAPANDINKNATTKVANSVIAEKSTENSVAKNEVKAEPVKPASVQEKAKVANAANATNTSKAVAKPAVQPASNTQEEKEVVSDVPIKGDYVKLVYKVKAGGEDLTDLCTRYNCNKWVIMKWNDIISDELNEGDLVKLYVHK